MLRVMLLFNTIVSIFVIGCLYSSNFNHVTTMSECKPSECGQFMALTQTGTYFDSRLSFEWNIKLMVSRLQSTHHE
jgi:hypothetical protein